MLKQLAHSCDERDFSRQTELTVLESRRTDDCRVTKIKEFLICEADEKLVKRTSKPTGLLHEQIIDTEKMYILPRISYVLYIVLTQ